MDIFLWLSGYDQKGAPLSRIFCYYLSRPYKAPYIHPEDYTFLARLLSPFPSGKAGGNSEPFTPFNLFALIEKRLPAHPNEATSHTDACDVIPRDVRLAAVENPNKTHFWGFNDHISDGKHVTAQNLAKTRLLISVEAFRYCSKNNISTIWSDSSDYERNADAAFRALQQYNQHNRNGWK